MQPVQKTIIDRCVRLVYQDLPQRPPARRICPSWRTSTTCCGRRTRKRPSTSPRRWKSTSPAPSTCSTTESNVDINNRIVCYDIKELGKQLKKDRYAGGPGPGVEPRHHQPRRPQVHPLLHRRDAPAAERGTGPPPTRWRFGSGSESGAASPPASRRTSKTCFLSSREVENIFENSDFVYMLNQAGGGPADSRQAAGHFPAPAFSYVTHSGEGEGLLFYGSTILPFRGPLPQEHRAVPHYDHQTPGTEKGG